jgi:hypothetical protein
VNAGNYERAIVPWRILAERNVTDSAAQEGMLALPFAYGKLDIHGRAAVYYGRALDTFGQELGKLDASIESIRKGNFLRALIREEIRQNKDWVIRLRSLPETPETYYLMELLASHDFQTGLQNYLDLADLRRKLHAWKTGLDAFRYRRRLSQARFEDAFAPGAAAAAGAPHAGHADGAPTRVSGNRRGKRAAGPNR